MTASISVNRQCSRCPRLEATPISLEDVAKLAKTGLKAPIALSVSVAGQPTLEFVWLCSECRSAVSGYLGQIGKPLKHASSKRVAGLRRKKKIDVEIDVETAAEEE